MPHVLKSQETLPLLDNLGRFLKPENYGPYELAFVIPKALFLKAWKELIEKKIEMVDNLIEIEAAVQLLNEGQSKDENENPIDQNYKKLNTDITVLDKGKNPSLLIGWYKEGIFAYNLYI